MLHNKTGQWDSRLSRNSGNKRQGLYIPSKIQKQHFEKTKTQVVPLVERVTGLLHKISALASSFYSLKGPWTTPAPPMSHKCMQVPAMTLRTTCDKHFFFSLQGLPLMCLLYRAPKKLNKTWFLWSELTNLVLAQEPQSTSFVDPAKSRYLGSAPLLLPIPCLDLLWPLKAGCVPPPEPMN